MKVLLQRVSRASVAVDGEQVAEIGPGLLLFVGVAPQDTVATAGKLAEKVAGLRVFDDATGKPNLSVLDSGGEVLVVSQFTLLADLSRGRRPSYSGAARPEHARELVEAVASRLVELGLRVARGSFGAHMEVSLVNDGPVTLMLEG